MWRLQIVTAIILTLAVVAGQEGAPTGRYNADRRVDFLHMKLQLRFTAEGLRAGTCEGRVEYTWTPTATELREIQLDAAAMKITSVELPGLAAHADYTYDDQQLKVLLPRPVKPGETARVAVSYRLEQPVRGMYFTSSDATKGKPLVYTMGEGLEARHWLPAHDWPNERWTSEINLTVPESYMGVANGALLGQTVAAGAVTYRWKSDQPTDAHLTGVVVGELVKVEEKWRGKPVMAFVPAGREAAARYSLRRVPEILEYFSELTGVEYPYPGYTHAGVPGHFHRGMEHAGFSMIDPLFFAAGAGRDGWEPLEPGWPGYTIETNLVAHMLSHQWFGGVVNYRSIPHAWLNEGFGTYLHLCWTGKAYSEDTFRYFMRQLVARIAAQDTPDAGKPMVPEAISSPMEIYGVEGGKVYWKGAWVVHMLRAQLGEAVFRKGLAIYLKGHQWGGVETSDLRRAMEEASGQDLERFFDRWVYGRAVPQVKVRYRWDPAAKKALVHVEQTQKMSEAVPAFVFPLTLYFRTGGADRYETLWMDKGAADVVYDFAAEPALFAADPKADLLATYEVDVPSGMLERMADEAPDLHARWQAIEALGKRGGTASIEALEKVVGNEGVFWGLRAEAARELGRIGTPTALEALLRRAAQSPRDVRAHGWLLVALRAAPYSTEAHRVLNEAAQGASPANVRAMALNALGWMRSGAGENESTLRILTAAAQPGELPAVQIGALTALGLREEVSTYETVLAAAQPGHEHPARARAMWAMARIGRAEALRVRTRDALEAWFSDPELVVRLGAIRAAGEHGDPGAARSLAGLVASARSPLEREAAEWALKSVRSSGGETAIPSRQLLERITEMERQNAALRQKIEEIQRKLDAAAEKK